MGWERTSLQQLPWFGRVARSEGSCCDATHNELSAVAAIAYGRQPSRVGFGGGARLPTLTIDSRLDGEATMADRVLRACGVTVAVCTVVVTTLVANHAWREWRGVTTVNNANAATTLDSNEWAELIREGHSIGPSDAPLTVVEFGDFECPSCRWYAHNVLDSLRARYPHAVRVVYRHLPLTAIHRFAYPAARAAECAAEQGRFAMFHDALFAKADSLGLKGFDSFARETGVADLDAFTACNAKSAPVANIERDRQVAAALGISATPTVIVNARRYARPPELAVLEAMARASVRGRP